MNRRIGIKGTISKIKKGDKNLNRAANILEGQPFGGWAETNQAMRQLEEYLPSRENRTYTIAEFIDAVYTVDSADRYRRKI